MDPNPSIFLRAAGDSYIAPHPIDLTALESDSVCIRIAYTGVCGSDIHFWTHGGMGLKVAPTQPLVMGHEASGTVHAIGKNVTSVNVGDRVAIEPGFPCRRCRFCKSGCYNLCGDMKFAASPVEDGIPLHGTLAKFFVIPADFVFKLSETVSLREGVMVEPLAVACKSVRHVEVRPEDVVVVFGAGTVGLLCCAVALAVGASRVICVDSNPRKLEFLKKWLDGRVSGFCPTPVVADPQKTATEIANRMSSGRTADVVIEATGAESCILIGTHVLRKGGRYIQTGLGKERVDFPIMMVSEKELTIKGHFRYMTQDFEMAIGLITRGAIDVNALISQEFAFENATDAWEATKNGNGIKNLIKGFQD